MLKVDLKRFHDEDIQLDHCGWRLVYTARRVRQGCHGRSVQANNIRSVSSSAFQPFSNCLYGRRARLGGEADERLGGDSTPLRDSTLRMLPLVNGEAAPS